MSNTEKPQLKPLFVQTTKNTPPLSALFQELGDISNITLADFATLVNMEARKSLLSSRGGVLNANVRSLHFNAHAYSWIVSYIRHPLLLRANGSQTLLTAALVPYPRLGRSEHPLFEPPRKHQYLSQVPPDILANKRLATNAFRRVVLEGRENEPLAAFTSIEVYQQMGYAIPEGFEIPQTS